MSYFLMLNTEVYLDEERGVKLRLKFVFPPSPVQLNYRVLHIFLLHCEIDDLNFYHFVSYRISYVCLPVTHFEEISFVRAKQ